MNLLRVQPFDLVLLCQTLDAEEAAQMASLAHGVWPGARILRFVILAENGCCAGDYEQIAPADPKLLTERVKALLAA